MTLAEKKDKIVEELSLFPDAHERLAYVIEHAKKMPPLSSDYKIEEFRIEGCQSNLWVVPTYEGGKCFFKTDSDAVITKGIAGILTEFYSDYSPGEILQNEPDFLAEVGITQHLTPNRRNGLTNVWANIRGFAELCRDRDPASA